MHVIGIEDSAAGVLSLRLAGFDCIGISGGNIEQSGLSSLCKKNAVDLMDALEFIFTAGK